MTPSAVAVLVPARAGKRMLHVLAGHSNLRLMKDEVSPVRPFPVTGGECSAILDAIDWSSHPLGDPVHWPVELKTAVRICLTSKFASMVHWGPDLHTFYNDAYAVRLGRKHPGHLGQPAFDWWSEMWDQLEPFLQKVLAGDSYYTENARYTPDRDGVAKDAFFTHSHSPIWDDAGHVRGIFLTVFETTAQLQAEARSELLTNELKHRMKNTLTIVQAIVSQSMRAADTKADAAAIIRDQIAVLSRTHDLLTPSAYVEAPLRQVVESAAGMQGPFARRIMVDGPELMLNSPAAIAFTMVLHELHTNAMKYGALSNDAGQVNVSWRLQDAVLEMTWQETGGPPVTPPGRSGFGTRLMMALSGDLGGRPEVAYTPEGVIFTLRSDVGAIKA